MAAALLKTWPVVRLTCQKSLTLEPHCDQKFVLVYLPKVIDKLIRNYFHFPELLQQAASSWGFPYFARPLSIAWDVSTESRNAADAEERPEKQSTEASGPDFSAHWEIKFFVQRVIHTPQLQHHHQWGHRLCVITGAIPCNAGTGLTRVQWGSLMPNNM